MDMSKVNAEMSKLRAANSCSKVHVKMFKAFMTLAGHVSSKKEQHMHLECTIVSRCCELVNTSKDEWRKLKGYEPCLKVQVLPRQGYLRSTQTTIR